MLSMHAAERPLVARRRRQGSGPAGLPELDAPLEAMAREHAGRARLAGVCPADEWRAVMEPGDGGGGGADGRGGRMPDWRALLREEAAASAERRLTAAEIVAIILYTGPMVGGPGSPALRPTAVLARAAGAPPLHPVPRASTAAR